MKKRGPGLFFEKNAKIIDHLPKKFEYTVWKVSSEKG